MRLASVDGERVRHVRIACIARRCGPSAKAASGCECDNEQMAVAVCEREGASYSRLELFSFAAGGVQKAKQSADWNLVVSNADSRIEPLKRVIVHVQSLLAEDSQINVQTLHVIKSSNFLDLILFDGVKRCIYRYEGILRVHIDS